jgi:hypothetical protein
MVLRNFLLMLSSSILLSQAFTVQLPQKTRSATPLFATTESISDTLTSVLKKASKTLAVLVDYDGPEDASAGDLATLSMQLRKVNAAAVVTSDVTTAAAFVAEQATAQGNFPGPCPVIYSGDDVEGAIQAGVAAVIVDSSRHVLGSRAIRKVSSPAEAEKVSAGEAYLVDADKDYVEDLLAVIPVGSVVIASMKSMQNDNAELERGKELKMLGVTSVLLEKACVGDGEDVQYASFAINGLTKKKSSTFNMSGLTGSTNGHFGGVASSTTTTWLRVKRT